MEVELKGLLRVLISSLLIAWIVNHVYAARRRRQVSTLLRG